MFSKDGRYCYENKKVKNLEKSKITTRDYKNFCNDKFWEILTENLSRENINTICSGLDFFFFFNKFSSIH